MRLIMKKIILMCTIACMGSLMAEVAKDNSTRNGQNFREAGDSAKKQGKQKNSKRMAENNARKALYGMSDEAFEKHIENAQPEELKAMKEEAERSGDTVVQKKKDRFAKKITVQDEDLGLGGLFEEPVTEYNQDTLKAMRNANEVAAQKRAEAAERRSNNERKIKEDTNAVSKELISEKPQQDPVRRKRTEETRAEPEIKIDEKTLTAELSALEDKIEQIRRRARALEQDAAKFAAVKEAVTEENKEDRRAVRD